MSPRDCSRKGPYEIIRSRYVTEKTRVLEELHTNTSNKSVAKCSKPKYVFLVDPEANKSEIAESIEMIYSEKHVKVTDVNTINIKRKKRRVRGRLGFRAGAKKAIASVCVVVCILFGFIMGIAGSVSEYPELGWALFGFFLIIAISIPIGMYYVTGQSCPLCKAEQWGVPE